jgi:hypothetical protein
MKLKLGVAVDIEQSVSRVGFLQLAVRDGLGEPVVRLAGEREYPARHCYGHPISGELAHERVEPLPGRLACER